MAQNISADVESAQGVESAESTQLNNRNADMPLLLFILAIAFFVLMIIGLAQSSSSSNVIQFFNSFVGITVQGFAFLAVGVMLSNAVHIFVPMSFFEKMFARSSQSIMHTIGAFCAAIILSLILPVCDCAAVPMFSSLVRKNVPLPIAITFLLSAPVANPIVVWSTYYAFSGSWSVVGQRIACAIIVAVLSGILVGKFTQKMNVFSNYELAGEPRTHNHSMLENELLENGNMSFKQKIAYYFADSEREFLELAGFLFIGATVASLFSVSAIGSGVKSLVSAGKIISQGGVHNFIVAILGMIALMLLGFILSVCSSSDAVIARSIATYMPMNSVFGFMIFGPMMDIKNVLMLRKDFSVRFIAILAGTIATVCVMVLSVRMVVMS